MIAKFFFAKLGHFSYPSFMHASFKSFAVIVKEKYIAMNSFCLTSNENNLKTNFLKVIAKIYNAPTN